MATFLYISVLLVGGAVAVIIGKQSTKARQQELAQLALQMGLEFIAEPGELFHRYEGLAPFEQGSNKKTSDLLRGRKGILEWEMFDYEYTTTNLLSRPSLNFHLCGVVCAIAPLALPCLSIYRQSIMDRFADAVVGKEVATGNQEFDRQFQVVCADPDFVRDLINERVIHHLLAESRTWEWHIRGQRVVLMHSGIFSVDDIRNAMRAVEKFIALIPAQVREKHAI